MPVFLELRHAMGPLRMAMSNGVYRHRLRMTMVYPPCHLLESAIWSPSPGIAGNIRKAMWW